MNTPEEKAFFLENGYLHAKGVLSPEMLARTQSEFDRVWEAEGSPCNQHKLLKHEHFINLIEHPPILDRHAAMFGRQTQLLQYDFLRQGPQSKSPERGWHRDFSHRGDHPVSINTILYLDDMTEDRGPTRVVPGSHRGEDWPPAGQRDKPLPNEVAVHAAAGDAVFINSAIWHSGGRNNTDGLRRGIYLYYGYWWLKRYDAQQTLAWQALENASERRLRLLGVKMPDRDLHMYDPRLTF
ncbi:MAG: phytanoyl-CoA dioxygenase family protein [Planctomycetota bacterium]|nr:phytanoyl-CoA dioxygenase family protein [Planctomycetota bacterium]